MLELAQQSAETATVRQCVDADEPAWQTFVQESADATFFHSFGWRRVISNSFGHAPHYLVAERENKVCGILPLFHLHSMLFGRALVSVPFCVYGGILAADPGVADKLAAAAMDLANELRVDYLELRHRERQAGSWPVKDDLYVTFRKEIAADPEQNLMAIPRKQRAMIRKGEKAGLDVHVTTESRDLYAMYSESVRNLGTPVFARHYFDQLQQEFGDACETTIITHEGRPVAGVMSFYFKNEVLPYYGGGSSAARSVSANDYMYWQVMCRAAERGVRVFDYGRSKLNTGSYRFKKHWGFTPEPLFYEYGLVRATEIPNLSPTNPRYGKFIRMWKKLPLPLSRLIGPVIARNLG